MLTGIGTVTGNLYRLGHIFLQIISSRSSVGVRQSVDTTDKGLQGNSVGIGPRVAIAGNSLGKAVVALLVRLYQIQRRTVTTATTGTCSRDTYREIVGFKSTVICRHTATENNLANSCGITPVGIADEEPLVVVRQLHATSSTSVNNSLVGLGSLAPQFLVVIRVEQRTGMVEGSTGTQGQHSQIVGTPVISGCHSQVAQVTIVLSNGILDSHTLVVDKLEDFIGRSTWLNICLISWQILCYQRHTTILANQQEVEIGTSPAGLPLVVVILIHLGHKVLVEFVVFKLQTSELI